MTDAVRTLFALADEFDLAGVKDQAARLHATDAYERLALDRAAAASEEALRRIAIDVLKSGKSGEAGVTAWVGTKGAQLAATKATIADLMATPLNQAKLTVLGGLLGDLARS